MADKIKIMISSRCNDKILCSDGGLTFTDLRNDIKSRIETELLLSKDIFEVLISEDFIVTVGNDSLRVCLDEIRKADIVIILFNGNSGYAEKSTGSVGICRAELEEALFNNYHKTYSLNFVRSTVTQSRIRYADGAAFIDYTTLIRKPMHMEFNNKYTEYKIFDKAINDPAGMTMTQFKDHIYLLFNELLVSAIVKLIKECSRPNLKYTSGESLKWSELKYTDRKKEIETVLTNNIKEYVDFNDFIIKTSAIPDSMSVSEARAMSGRPFIEDFKSLVAGKNKGVIHFMGIFKNATETQMQNLIGHPDVNIVSEDFGFYVWDNVNHIQIIALVNCRDSISTKKQLYLFYSWMKRNGKLKEITDRAKKRYKIITTIEKQQH